MRRSVRTALGTVSAAATLATLAVSVSSPALAATGTFGYGTPAFADLAAPSTFTNANNAGEPSIGTDFTTGATLFQANTSTYKLTVDPAGTPTWADVSSPYSQFNLDPILATDHATGITLAGGDNGACGVLSRSTNDGASWTPTLPCPGAVDHETVGFGPFAGGTTPTGGSGTRAAYYCQQTTQDACSRSLDGGQTFSPATPISGCTGLFGHVKVAADGTAYVPDNTCTNAASTSLVGGFKSSDNGLTWTGYTIPGAVSPSRGFDPSVSTTPDGTLYEAWARNGDQHPVIASSHDHGATWSTPVDLAATTSPALATSTFQAVVAGDNNRLAVSYLASTVPVPAGLTGFDAGYHGIWNLYTSYSYDGGATWTTVQATADPVQRGYICDAGTTCTAGRNLLDFIDSTVTSDGRVETAFADGCTVASGCAGSTGTEAQSVDAYATVARQTVGKGLFAAYDTTPATAPAAPGLTASATRTGVSLHWTVPANHGAAITGYKVYRGTASGKEILVATLGAVTRYADTTAAAGTKEYYQVAAVNTVGAGARSNQVSVVAG